MNTTTQDFSNFWIYDIETLPNCFTMITKNPYAETVYCFEISERRDDSHNLFNFLNWLRGNQNAVMVGYNNMGFDWPVLDAMCKNIHWYYTCEKIINTPWENRNDNVIWNPDIYQCDLMRLNRYACSLKKLEIALNMENVQESSIPFGKPISVTDIDELLAYNYNDVLATEKLFIDSLPKINLRLATTGINSLWWHDVKAGYQYFKDNLTFNANNDINKAVNLSEIIFPYIKFNDSEFNRVLNYLKSQTITETNSAFDNLICDFNSLQFKFGTGGLHASQNNITVDNSEWVILDIDVASYYPNIAIKNNLRPESAPFEFTQVYENLYKSRSKFKKETPENKGIKLSLNSMYGQSLNKYSDVYDPKYAMSITINGQLMLCMLAEWLREFKLLQVNTDGLTIMFPEYKRSEVQSICDYWQFMTKGLILEFNEYDLMHIRDVNNYLARHKDTGKTKLIGAYRHDLDLDKNHSSKVVAKAAEYVLTNPGTTPADFVLNHANIYDFMITASVDRKSKVVDSNNNEYQRVNRYYVANNGVELYKLSPPPEPYEVGQWKRANGVSDQEYENEMRRTGGQWSETVCTKNGSQYSDRKTAFAAGWLVQVCNIYTDFDWRNLNYDYYINEVTKLL